LEPAGERSGYFLQDGASPHIAKEISEHYASFGELNADDRIIDKSLWPLDPEI
jgi:hypothetical protein